MRTRIFRYFKYISQKQKKRYLRSCGRAGRLIVFAKIARIFMGYRNIEEDKQSSSNLIKLEEDLRRELPEELRFDTKSAIGCLVFVAAIILINTIVILVSN